MIRTKCQINAVPAVQGSGGRRRHLHGMQPQNSDHYLVMRMHVGVMTTCRSNMDRRIEQPPVYVVRGVTNSSEIDDALLRYT